MKRTFLPALTLLWALLQLPAGPAVAQEVLDGTYRGIGDATGQVLVLAPDPGGFTGELTTPDDGAQPVLADRIGIQAEAVVDLAGRTHFMQVTPEPHGAEVVFVPYDEETGLLISDGAVLHTFVREGWEMPVAPRAFVRPPTNPRLQIAGNSFLNSYPYWRPSGVVAGYMALPERMRTLMRLYPAVQLDVIWKLCLAPESDRALAEALPGAGVDCATVVAGLDGAQRSGGIDAYRDAVRDERRALQTAVLCADGYRMTERDCTTAAERLSNAAISLETPASVLSRYR